MRKVDDVNGTFLYFFCLMGLFFSESIQCQTGALYPRTGHMTEV